MSDIPYSYPYYPREPKRHPRKPRYAYLKYPVLRTVEPFVQYGLREAKYTSFEHALREVAAITYLMGRGYNPRDAHQIVESWEVNERF
ncbi:hypothetical protein [Thermoflavimicrobium daqui]|uniref:hypothetical protein n=1 Tax=Thermoflavimicrobium daqui TaxID=2137476 RepID=UPI001F0C8046|nr:hypothetical protein [Thermoflavimicrobium daqui]